ncbi:MAG: phosphodiester glycosidase family protein [Clostridia bacterium]|nr:phosphodiester glycosidase family protein [Clostridia bacterium]
MKYTRILLFLFILRLLTVCSLSAYTPEENIVAKETTHIISPGLTYKNSVEINNGIRQEIFTFEYSPNSKTKIIPAYGQYIYGFNTVGSMISSYNGEGRVVGGINTDFFITSTGIPLSCMISEREIITSCDSRIAIGFNENGYAKIGYPNITTKLIPYNGTPEISIAHINKTPSEWGIFLVTDKFYKTTKSSHDCVEVVLMPYDKEKTEENLDKYSGLSNEENNIVIDEDTDIVENSIHEDTIFSEHNNTTTDEQAKETDNFKALKDLYVFQETRLTLGSEIDVVVTEIRSNINSPIPNGSFVICVPRQIYDVSFRELKLGDSFLLKTDYDTYFSDCTNIFGAGTQIIEDGMKIPQENNTVFKYRQPRTAAGIREDGTVVFVCVDGRNPGVSSGYTADELSDYLIEMGCVNAVNFDGGGSTTFYASDIGENNSELKNTPSDKSERRVACGLIFVNTAEPTEELKFASMYPSEHFVYNSGVSIDIGEEILFADSNSYPVDIEDDDIELFVDVDYGIIQDNKFIPSGTPGIADIYTLSDDYNSLLHAGRITITDKVDNLEFNADNMSLTPFQSSTKLSIAASLNTIPVEITPKSGEYTVLIEKKDEINGTYLSPVSEAIAHIDLDSFEFIPVIKGQKYIVQVSLGGINELIEIYSEDFPFIDIAEHWANETTYHMFKENFFEGEVDENGNRLFYPDRNITVAEFCVVLSRILGLENISEEITINSEINLEDVDSNNETEEMLFENTDKDNISTEKPNSENILTEDSDTEDTIAKDIPKEDTVNEKIDIFEDVPDWAIDAVKVLYKNGYIHSLIDADENGTEYFSYDRLMTRMDVIRVLGAVINSATEVVLPEDFEADYSDFIPETEDDKLYIGLLLQNKILEGYEDGTIRQNATLTRAEAATVFYRMINLNITDKVSQ